MNLRPCIPVLSLFLCSSLLAQPEITNITFQGDVAILTRNTPPPGITYYWQGTSCGTLMNHSGSTTVASTNGVYCLRAYSSTGSSWAPSCSCTTVEFPDYTPPVLSSVTSGPIEEGDPIAATSNEDGLIYLVPDGTPADYSSILAAAYATASATAYVPVSLSTGGISLGDYIVYAVDIAHNVSTASAVITITDLTPPVLSDVTPGPIEEGDPVEATSNENGTIYLVPDGTPADYSSIIAAVYSAAAATANVPASLSTALIALGDYIVYAVDSYENVSTASAVITITDLTAPVLSDVTAGPIEVGSDILATSNEDGMIYLVPDGTAADLGAITSVGVAQASVTANTPGTLSTIGIDAGSYVVFAVDGSENVSAASPAISVTAATSVDLYKTDANRVQIFPVNVTDILHIRSGIQVSSIRVYSLSGTQVIDLTIPTDQVDMSGLHAGVYVVVVTLEDGSVFHGKVNRQ